MASNPATARKETNSRLQRDIIWGRLLFLPPELANPRIVFDPTPFRGSHFPGIQNRKTPGTH